MHLWIYGMFWLLFLNIVPKGNTGVRLAIWYHLFLEFWLAGTWYFAHPRDQRAVTCLRNVCQLNVRWDKKLGFPLSHRQPRNNQIRIRFQSFSKFFWLFLSFNCCLYRNKYHHKKKLLRGFCSFTRAVSYQFKIFALS